MDIFSKFLEMDFATMVFILILCIAPAIVWYNIFEREYKEKLSTSFYAIIAGGLSTIPVLAYQQLWGKEVNMVFLKTEAINFQENISQLFGFSGYGDMLSMATSSNFFTVAVLTLFTVFLGVGFLEEVSKHVLVNPAFMFKMIIITILAGIGLFITGGASLIGIMGLLFYILFLSFMPKMLKFKSIDDIVSIGISSAIGFALVENIIYFSHRWVDISSTLGIDSVLNANMGSLGEFLGFVAIRVTIVTMIHILCSGVLAYHFGLAYFAKPKLQDEIREGRKHPIIEKIHKIFGTPEDKIFHYEQLFLALFLATLLHGIYNLIAQLNFSILGIPAIALAMPIYFIGGFLYLFSKLEEKENRKKFGQLHVKEEFGE
ncbi:PrsW family glutamic-type intramembrane protease [Candidatus Gracilibacteria bacterium]|nr:PrsW family glutamic-type intramembrane protease [Candidatus Gracilibacteria bacterium]